MGENLIPGDLTKTQPTTDILLEAITTQLPNTTNKTSQQTNRQTKPSLTLLYTLNMLKILVVLLALGCMVQGSAGYCWEDVDVSLEFHQRHVFYFTSCYNGYYAGNYTVKAYQGNFDVEYGDQLCGTHNILFLYI